MPIVSRGRLRIAARAFTCFLRTLVVERPTSFLIPDLNDMGHWVRRLAEWSPVGVVEPDGKEPFDHIHCNIVIQRRRHGCDNNMVVILGWIIHKENKILDRAARPRSPHLISFP